MMYDRAQSNTKNQKKDDQSIKWRFKLTDHLIKETLQTVKEK